jgi:methylated-DNA-[protein]-cysteine S-methyltransferase
MFTTAIGSPLGTIVISANDDGITSVVFDEAADRKSTETFWMLDKAADQLFEYFAGKREEFDLPLAPAGTDFQRRVWSELQHIPYGKTVSYLDISKSVGDPKAIRAVGLANGRDPVAIVIPCHRVIGSDGSLTGYAGGLWRKEWLLRHEGALMQTTLF